MLLHTLTHGMLLVWNSTVVEKLCESFYTVNSHGLGERERERERERRRVAITSFTILTFEWFASYLDAARVNKRMHGWRKESSKGIAEKLISRG